MHNNDNMFVVDASTDPSSNMDVSGSAYCNDPQTLDDFKNNAFFQLRNTIGWMNCGEFDNALIKAKCLVVALEVIETIKNKS